MKKILFLNIKLLKGRTKTSYLTTRPKTEKSLSLSGAVLIAIGNDPVLCFFKAKIIIRGIDTHQN